MPELVLYGIRLLAKQFLGTVLDIEVDQSDLLPIYVILAEWSKARRIGGRQEPAAGWKSLGLKYKSMLFSFLRGAKVSEKTNIENKFIISPNLLLPLSMNSSWEDLRFKKMTLLPSKGLNTSECKAFRGFFSKLDINGTFVSFNSLK